MLQEPGRTLVSRYNNYCPNVPSPYSNLVFFDVICGSGSVLDSASNALQLVRRQHVDSGAPEVDSLFHRLYQSAVDSPTFAPQAKGAST